MTTRQKYQTIGSAERWVYEERPLFVYWEATRACDLACVHCRAEAVPRRHPEELDTAEAKALLEQIAAFGGPRRPHLILTGGDPLNRPDLFALIRYGRSRQIPISVTPAGTPKLTDTIVARFKEADIVTLGLSLDGSNEERHDTFRGQAGSFTWTLHGIRAARDAGLPVQVNTMVTAETLDDIAAVYELLSELGIARWALFFLIATGRGQTLQSITPAQSERFLNWVGQIIPKAPFPIKTTEAHHYRRIVYTKMKSRGMPLSEIARRPVGRGFGVRDGNGIVFVSHKGEVFPSGFLPHSAGNVRDTDLADIYRHSELFTTLRDVEQLGGKCGVCEFRAICGGSRARAYAAAGDPLAADPLCPYQPREREAEAM